MSIRDAWADGVDEEEVGESEEERYVCVISVARCEEQRSSISPMYSAEVGSGWDAVAKRIREAHLLER